MEAPVVRSVATPLAGGGSHRRTGEHGEKALMTLWRNLVVALVAAFALAACSSSSDTPEMTQEPDPGPSAYEMAVAAIDTAATAAEAEAAVATAVAAGITGAELQRLNMAVQARIDELDAAAAAEQRQALVTAAECDDATAACLMAHEALVTALMEDLAALQADDDATNAEEQAAQMAIDDAEEARDMIRMALNDATRDTDIGMKVTDAEMKAAGLEDEFSAELIEAAKEAIEAAKEAIAGGDDPDAFSEEISTAERHVARAEESLMIYEAIDAAEMAADGLADDSSVEAVAAAQKLIDDAQALIDGNEHLTDEEEAADNSYLAGLQRTVTVAKNNNDAAAEAKRLADEKAAADKDKADAAAMAATAAKLYAGIDVPSDTAGANERDAEYSSTNDSQITVTIGEGSGNEVALSEDKKTMVPANHGWAGKRFADPVGGDEYEAMVYSNVEAPTPGKKFGSAVAGSGAADSPYQYLLAATATGTTVLVGELAITGDVATATVRIDSPSFDHTAGTKEFEKGDNLERVVIAGSYHGVSGTYYCTPAAASTCAAEAAANGFTLGGTANDGNAFTTGAGTWAFKPGNPEARVMSAMDTAYSSYGWWIRTATDGKVTVSAFHDHKDGATAPPAANLPEAGTATYVGGAAGKYALSSATGGTNDSGHFTARATLEAEFGVNDANTISGTIDQFVGADGESRDWSVKLNETDITDAGVIDGLGGPDDTQVGTVWTIGDKAAAKSGLWSGALREQGDDNVPQAATGAFYSEYGPAGKMVGAFGANKQ